MEKTTIIKRKLYIEKVKPHILNESIKVLTGHRRSGKSYMMMDIMRMIRETDPGANLIYINKEYYEFDALKDYHQLQEYFEEKCNPAVNNYFFVDGIQEIDHFELCIRDIQAKRRADIYISGSNSEIMSGELATMLSGRFIEIRIHPLSYTEFLDFFKLAGVPDSFRRYLQYGGMPGLLNIQPGNIPVNDYLKGILSTVLLKDVVARFNIRNVSFLENLVQYLAGNTGSLVSAKNISDFLKSQRINVSPNLVLDYLSHLCSSYLISKVRRMEITGKKVFEVGEKYYFEDTGLRNCIAGFNPADMGKLLENVVYNHLLIGGYTIHVGQMGNKEIDFIASRDGETIYVQVCYLLSGEKVMEREFDNLLVIPDNYKKYVVSMDTYSAPNTYKGIEHWNISAFCEYLAS